MAEPQTPCTVCRTHALLGKAFMADRGMNWPTTTVAGKVVHLACQSDAQHILEIVANRKFEVSATGVARWVSNSRPLFGDTVALITALGFGDGIDPAATARAQQKDTAVFLAAYRSSPPQYSAEQIAEMRVELGDGPVVDVITGQRIY